MKRRIKPALKIIGLALVVLLVAGAIYQAVASAADRRNYPMPGTLVDVGGYKLHLLCQGTANASPTVVLISGASDGWAVWEPVQKVVKDKSRVCSYDRPGLGWSDFSPNTSLTVDDQAEILHTLLQKAGESGRYIVVGHSIGGIIARKFAAAFPSEVAGMVLVESSVESQFTKLPSALSESNQSAKTIFTLCSIVAPVGLVRVLGLGNARIAAFPLLSDEAKHSIADVFNQTRGCTAMLRDGAMADEPLMTGKPAQPLGDIPLVVITRGLDETQSSPGRYSADQTALFQHTQTTWLELQKGLLALSTDSQWVIADKSGHYAHTTQPALVIEAITNVLGRTTK